PVAYDSRPPDFEWGTLRPESPSRWSHFAKHQHGAGVTDIGHYRQTPETRDSLAQEFEPLAGKIVLLDRQAGDVAARTRQARDQAGGDWVARHREHDRNDRCRLLC